jgi:hypothetical protein
VSVDDRGLIERAAQLLLASAPLGWTQLYAKFIPTAGVADAHVITPAGLQQLVVARAVLDVVVEHQRRAAAAGKPWAQLIIDCHADGRLSARTTPPGQPASQQVPSAPTVPPAVGAESSARRWIRRTLAITTAGLLTAAAIIFVVGLDWAPAPRAELLPEPAPPAREAQAFAVISSWFDAQNRSDVAELRRLVCSSPAPLVALMIKSDAREGETQHLVLPEMLTDFHDDGSTVTVTLVHRIRFLPGAFDKGNEHEQGLYGTDLTLVDEGGQLKVCNQSNIKQR